MVIFWKMYKTKFLHVSTRWKEALGDNWKLETALNSLANDFLAAQTRLIFFLFQCIDKLNVHVRSC